MKELGSFANFQIADIISLEIADLLLTGWQAIIKMRNKSICVSYTCAGPPEMVFYGR